MGTQITVRLSDEAANHMDRLVARGDFDSRAQYLTWLVEREAKRAAAYEDIVRLRATGDLHDPELELVVKATSSRPLVDLD